MYGTSDTFLPKKNIKNMLFFFGENDPPDKFYPPYYAGIWLQMP
jgi:hypothetical protein